MRSVINCKVNLDIPMAVADIQRVLKKILNAMKGKLRLGVYSDFVTRYLSLEYGVAGKAMRSEKSEYGTVASTVVIPQRGLKYSDKRGNKYLVYWSNRDGAWSKHKRYTGSLPIIYQGVAPLPRGIVRAVRGDIIEIFKEAVFKAINRAFSEGRARSTSKVINADKVKEIYKEEVMKLGDIILAMVRSRTPRDKAQAAVGMERTQQLIRAGRNIQHLADDGYFIDFKE